MYTIEKHEVRTIGRDRRGYPKYKNEIRWYIVDSADGKPAIYDSQGYFQSDGVYFMKKYEAIEECANMNRGENNA